jgi:hypothetical protein
MKTKFPNQIDTSSELPVVRDGVTEISSEIFNSMRSAIIQIEKVLGINPQGVVGGTVGGRISGSLDGSGNLLREALERANVIFGQITNDNIADNGAIDESKLKLNIPTSVLQSEVSQVASLINGIAIKLDEISSILNLHLSPIARNRHKATSIYVETAENLSSEIATNSIQGDDLQSILKLLYSSHINLSAFATELNNSHKSSQIYFDNSRISTLTEAQNLQEAVEDIAAVNADAIIDSFSYLNSNGMVNFGKKTNSYESLSRNDILLQPSVISFSPSSASYSTIYLSEPTLPVSAINEFDILVISNQIFTPDDGEHYIKSVALDGTGKVTSIDIFSSIKTTASGATTVSVYKNAYHYSNKNGLNSAVRERPSYTNTPELVIAHPNAATIISSGLDATKVTYDGGSVSLPRYFRIISDESLDIAVDIYDGLSDPNDQNIDTIISKINETFLDQNFPALAYKIKIASCYELAITHLIPDLATDNKRRSLRIEAGEPVGSDATSMLGFSSILGDIFYGKMGNPLHINGVLQKNFYDIFLFTSENISFESGSNKIFLTGSSFYSYGINIGDMIYISDPEMPTDAYVARISSVSESQIEIEGLSVSFSGGLTENSIVFILKNTIKVSDLNFEIVSGGNGYMLIDAMADKYGRLLYSKRAEISAHMQSSGFFATVIDISSGYIKNDDVTITINTSGEAFITSGSPSINGEITNIFSSGEYKLRSPTNDGYIIIRVEYDNAPSSILTCTVNGLSEPSLDIYHISRFIFGPTLGRIFGFYGSPGIPNIIDKRVFGTIDSKQISPKFIEKYIEQPRHDLRGSGIISGCLISNVTIGSDAEAGDFVTFDVSSGVAVVNGVRFAVDYKSGIKRYTEEDFYVGISDKGCVSFLSPGSMGESPTSTSSISYAMIGFIRIDGSALPTVLDEDQKFFDLRFFIDRIDYKFSKEIIVATDQSEGHFTDIESAVRYASFYKKIYMTNGVRSTGGPTIRIREGVYEISKTILVDIDLQIIGSGPGTILKRAGDILNGDPYTLLENIDPLKCLFLVGGGTNSRSTNIIKGCLFKDFVFEENSSFSGDSSVFFISQNIGNLTGFFEDPPVFRFEGIQCYGPQIELDVAPFVSERFIVLSSTDETLSIPNRKSFGNVIVSGCYFNRMGDGAGIIKVITEDTSDVTIKNIICSGNIADNLYPDSATYPASSKLIHGDSYSFVNKINLREVNNAINDN